MFYTCIFIGVGVARCVHLSTPPPPELTTVLCGVYFIPQIVFIYTLISNKVNFL